MMARVLREDRKNNCPMYVIFGKTRNWGRYFNSINNKPQFISIYIKNITPNNFYEVIEHEWLHKLLVDTMKSDKTNWGIDKEHWVIEKILQSHDDWL